MTRINTNVPALVAQNNLSRSNHALSLSLERLSTGLRINRGSDDPAGLIVSERLRTEIAGVDQAVDNIERATNVIATAEAALTEINALLIDVKSLIVESANTGAFSKAEIEANQLQIDSAIESITRISNTTSFAGLKLLNGSLDYILSGQDESKLRDISVHGVNFGTSDKLPVTVEVLNSAKNAQLYLSGNLPGSPGALQSSVTFEVQGPGGVEVLSFASGTPLSAVVFSVNSVKDSTGVSASLVSATDQTSGLVMTSMDYGSDAFVSVRRLEQGEFFKTYDVPGGNVIERREGQDVLAMVNGSLAIGDGLDVSLNGGNLNIEMSLSVDTAQTTGTVHNFYITGGGATYQLGANVNSQNQVGFGVQSVAASHLGSRATGFLSSLSSGGANSLLAGRASEAGEIVDKAIDQISNLRGRLGAFERNTLQTTLRSSQVALENLTSAESVIRDTDFAKQTAELTRNQILQQSGMSTLGIANNSSQAVLSLLQ